MTADHERDNVAEVHRPRWVIFDVNETLSDMSLLSRAFEDIGLTADSMQTWFAGVLRDGFALTCVGANPRFADLAAEALRVRLSTQGEAGSEDQAKVAQVMSAFSGLQVHSDVVSGINLLLDAGVRMATLSNGPTATAESLLTRAGVRDAVELLMSVEQAGVWKPHRSSYAHALERCGVSSGDAMLVAVHPWDIDGAARAGLRTGWLNRNGKSYPDYFVAPEIEAASLPALAQILGSLPAPRTP